MALPNTFANLTAPEMQFLDENFAAVAALGIIPCSAAGGNSVVLTGLDDTPSLAAYADFQQFSFLAPAAPTGDVTVQFTGLGALKLFVAGSTTNQVTAGAYVSGSLLVVGYNAALDSAAGGFVLLSAIQPALAPATTAQVRVATDGSAAMTPLNMAFHPRAIAGAITFGSGPQTGANLTASYSQNMRVIKTGVGAYLALFSSTSPTQANYSVSFGAGQVGFWNWASVGTSGISITVRDITNSQNIDVGLLSVNILAGM